MSNFIVFVRETPEDAGDVEDARSGLPALNGGGLQRLGGGRDVSIKFLPLHTQNIQQNCALFVKYFEKL